MRSKLALFVFTVVAAAALGATVIISSVRPKRAGGVYSGLSTAEARELVGVLEAAYASTLAAFDPTADEPTDYEARDVRASADAVALQRTLDTVRAGLTSELAEVSQAFADNVAAAQLQIMAFAINRKNRGLPDSAEAEAETTDLNDFKRLAEPLYHRLVSALA